MSTYLLQATCSNWKQLKNRERGRYESKFWKNHQQTSPTRRRRRRSEGREKMHENESNYIKLLKKNLNTRAQCKESPGWGTLQKMKWSATKRCLSLIPHRYWNKIPESTMIQVHTKIPSTLFLGDWGGHLGTTMRTACSYMHKCPLQIGIVH